VNPEPSTGPLTALSEDENFFLATVRQFAQERIAPLTRRMDEDQHMDAGLVRSLFDTGEEEFEPNFPIALDADAI